MCSRVWVGVVEFKEEPSLIPAQTCLVSLQLSGGHGSRGRVWGLLVSAGAAQWLYCGSHAQEMALVCVRPAPCWESPTRVSTAVQLPQGHRHRRGTQYSQVLTLFDRFFSLQATSRGRSALGPGCLDSFSLPLSLRTCYRTNYSKRRISIWMLGIIIYIYRF